MQKYTDYLIISYPNFTLGTVIDPDEANKNNSEITNKINDVIDELGKVVDSLTASTGANEIGATVVGITGVTVQEILASLRDYVDTHKNNTNNPHNVTASQLGVYTKTDLDPLLSGGNTAIKYEVFTIISANNGNGTFTYKDKDNNSIVGTLTPEGYQTFTLQQGTYTVGENRISATINDTLQRSAVSGGLVETSSTQISLTTPEANGAEITFMYFERIGIVGTGLVQTGSTKPKINCTWFKVVG